MVDLATAAAGAEYPAWIKMAPRGPVTTRDGRSYSFDPEALAVRFAADGVAVPIDVNHATVLLGAKGEEAPAQGWITKVEPRQDGLYGEADWLDSGKAILKARTHRYISPAFPPDTNGSAAWMHSVALVSAPAIPNMPAIASVGPQPASEPIMKSLALALGLSESANEQACLSAIATLKAGTVEKAVHEQTLATLTATTNQLNELKKAQRDKDVAGVIEAGLKDGKIAPSQKESLTALCGTDEGLTHVKAMLAATAPGLRPSGLDGKTPPEQGVATDAGAVATLTAKARLHHKQQHDAGNPISWAEAVRAVEEDKS